LTIVASFSENGKATKTKNRQTITVSKRTFSWFVSDDIADIIEGEPTSAGSQQDYNHHAVKRRSNSVPGSVKKLSG
jgi:hypothetical protein